MTNPIQSSIVNLHFLQLQATSCLVSVIICTLHQGMGILINASGPTGVGNECGNLSQLKWIVSLWRKLRF